MKDSLHLRRACICVAAARLLNRQGYVPDSEVPSVADYYSLSVDLLAMSLPMPGEFTFREGLEIDREAVQIRREITG